LTKEQIIKLELLKIKWSLKIKDNWDSIYILCVNYFNKFGGLNVQRNYVANNINLGQWIYNQKRKHNNPSPKSGKLKVEQIKKLEELNIQWT